MTAKLTPRVGDRVLVKVYVPGSAQLQTRSGSIISTSTAVWSGVTRTDSWGVQVDGFADDVWSLRSDALTVVDRSPVEWPEGWSEYTYFEVLHEPSNVAIDKDALKHLLATGPAMLRDWPELMGGAE